MFRAMIRRGLWYAILILLAAPLAHAASISSNGTGGGNWTVSTTWSGGVVPSSVDTITIVNGDTVDIPDTSAIEVNGSLTIDATGALTITNGGGGSELKVGGTLSNTGTITNTAGNLWINSGTATNTGTVTSTGTVCLSGTGTWTNSTAGALSVSGSFNIFDLETGTTLTNNAGCSFSLTGGALLNGGIGCFVSTNRGGAIVNSGTITIGDVIGTGDFSRIASLTNNSGGVVNLVNGSLDDNGAISNSGTINLDAGTFLKIMSTDNDTSTTDGGNITNNTTGIINVGNLGFLVAEGGFTLSNSGTINSTSLVSAAGGTLLNTSTGTININPLGFLDITPEGFVINEGDINLTGTSVVVGVPITEGIEVRGTLLNDSGATIDITKAAIRNNAGDILNLGTITVLTGGVLLAADGVTSNEPGGVITNTSGSIVIETLGAVPATFINFGTINNNATATLGGTTFSGSLIGGNTLFNADGGVFNNGVTGTFSIEDSAQVDNDGIFDNDGALTIKAGGSFNNVGGTTINDGTATNDAIGVFSIGFCGKLTNNSLFTNVGELFKCGAIDGTTAITETTAIITTSCGSTASLSQLVVAVREAGTLTPITNAQVFVERLCVSSGFEAYFTATSASGAEYDAPDLEPAQYLVSVTAPGHEGSAPFLVVTEPLLTATPIVELEPLANAGATNTVEVEIAFGSTSLLTSNIQLIESSTVVFGTSVIFSDNLMIIHNVRPGTYTVRALSTSFSIPDSASFTLTEFDTEHVSLSAIGARSARGGVVKFGLIDGKVVRAGGSLANLLGAQVRVIDKQPQFDVDSGLTIKDPTYLIKINAVVSNQGIYTADIAVGVSNYFVVATTSEGKILSQDIIANVSIADGQTTNVEDITLAMLDTDLDGDGIPNTFELAWGLDPLDNACPNGANHDLDGDGLTNIKEFTLFNTHGTKPNTKTSDADSFEDGVEVFAGSQPNNPSNVPPKLSTVFVRFDYTASVVDCRQVNYIQVGTQKEPFRLLTDGDNGNGVITADEQVQNNGTIKIVNTGLVRNLSGALTLGGSTAYKLTVSDPNGPSVKIGVP